MVMTIRLACGMLTTLGTMEVLDTTRPITCKAGEYHKCERSKADAAAADTHWLDGCCSHQLREVQVEAKRASTDQHTRSYYTDQGDRVFSSCAGGDIIAIETMSNDEPFWLVRVVTKHENIRTERTNSAPQTRDKFRCPKDSNCVEVTKIFLSSLSASNTFCDDNDSRRFSVPSSLLRLKLELNGDYKAKETVPSTRSRSAVRGSGGSSGPVVYYELLSGVRHRIALACRALDADIES